MYWLLNSVCCILFFYILDKDGNSKDAEEIWMMVSLRRRATPSDMEEVRRSIRMHFLSAAEGQQLRKQWDKEDGVEDGKDDEVTGEENDK